MKDLLGGGGSLVFGRDDIVFFFFLFCRDSIFLIRLLYKLEITGRDLYPLLSIVITEKGGVNFFS